MLVLPFTNGSRAQAQKNHNQALKRNATSSALWSEHTPPKKGDKSCFWTEARGIIPSEILKFFLWCQTARNFFRTGLHPGILKAALEENIINLSWRQMTKEMLLI